MMSSVFGTIFTCCVIVLVWHYMEMKRIQRLNQNVQKLLDEANEDETS